MQLKTVAFPGQTGWKPGAALGAASRPMQAHQRMPWKPVGLPQNPNLGQSGGATKTVALGALLLPTAAAAAVSFVGFRLGSKDDDGFVSTLGYIVGVLGGLSAFLGILAMLGVAVTPFDLAPKTSEVSLPAQLPAPAPTTKPI
ncbi:MAG TPA: hypothetical protein VEO56_07775 [Bacteroidota bacterium]|nr:hypothetical protein [Bacteroidota bacterium]